MELRQREERSLKRKEAVQPQTDAQLFVSAGKKRRLYAEQSSTKRPEGGRGGSGKLWKAAGALQEVGRTVQASTESSEDPKQENPFLDVKVTQMLAYVSKARTKDQERGNEERQNRESVSESDTERELEIKKEDRQHREVKANKAQEKEAEIPSWTQSEKETIEPVAPEKKEDLFQDTARKGEWWNRYQKKVKGQQEQRIAFGTAAGRTENPGDEVGQRIHSTEKAQEMSKHPAESVFKNRNGQQIRAGKDLKEVSDIPASRAVEAFQEAEKRKVQEQNYVSGKKGKNAGQKTAKSLSGKQVQTAGQGTRTAEAVGKSAKEAGKAKASGKSTVFTFAEAALKAAQKIKQEGFGKEKQEQAFWGKDQELRARAEASVQTTSLKAGNFFLYSLFVVPIFPVLLVLIVLCLVFGSTSQSGSGLSAQYDRTCYLAAKYESGGNPDQTGGDGGNACGEFQFDNRYELGPFVSWCYEQDPIFYATFQPFLGMTTELKSNEDFYQAWHTVCAANKEVFEAAQCEYVYTYTLMSLLQEMTEHYGFDFVNCSDALKGCILSFGNRDGKYVASIRRYFDGTTSSSTDREIIERAYNAMITRRPSIQRWRYEKQDCLAILDGSLDVYAPSENAAGSIDWSWKRIAGGSEIGNQVAQLAVSKVGCGYSQARRDEEGWYDCSSLVYRCYAETGITYLNGLTAAEEARYLVEHGMTVSREELQPGDIIFYSYEENGRYRNISHVAIYIGNNEMVHAANTSRGVVRDPLRESNLSEPLYCRPQ